MSGEEKPRCATCRFYLARPLEQTGECWCLPPQMIPVNQGGQLGMMGVRPQVPENAYCGQYRPKPQDPDPAA